MKKKIFDKTYKQCDLEEAGNVILGMWEYASDMYDFILDDDGNEMGKFRVIVEWISNEYSK